MDKKIKKNYEIHEILSDKQQAMYEEWISHIKAIYGEYGSFTWKITSTGIGNVYSRNTPICNNWS